MNSHSLRTELIYEQKGKMVLQNHRAFLNLTSFVAKHIHIKKSLSYLSSKLKYCPPGYSNRFEVQIRGESSFSYGMLQPAHPRSSNSCSFQSSTFYDTHHQSHISAKLSMHFIFLFLLLSFPGTPLGFYFYCTIHSIASNISHISSHVLIIVLNTFNVRLREFIY